MLGHKRSDGQLERATSLLARETAFSAGVDGIGVGVTGVRASLMANASSGNTAAVSNSASRRRRPRAASARAQRPSEEAMTAGARQSFTVLARAIGVRR